MFATHPTVESHSLAHHLSDFRGCGGVQTLLGKRDDPLLTVFSRHLAEMLRLSKPLVLMLALAENGRDTEICKGIVMEALKLRESQSS